MPPQGTKSKRIGRGKLVRLCILAFSLVFTAYLFNAVVSGKSPFYFSGSRSSEEVGITHGPPRSL